jgi:beta-xylosidase
VAQATATVNGMVDPDGQATSFSFQYGPTNAYGSATAPQGAGSGTAGAPAVTGLTGLSALTTYHYRLVAVSSAGTAYGTDATFTTTAYYENPVFSDTAFPDPFVLDNNNAHSDYWAFGTGDLFPVLHSSDLIHWTSQGTAMAARPAWAAASGDWHPWSPSVIQSGRSCPGTASSGCYIMYYVGLSAQLNTNCIGVATSPVPGGPYTDQGPLESTGASNGTPPIGCEDAQGKGNIDPSPFTDSSGQEYLYMSTDRSCTNGSCVLAPTISVIPLTPDMLAASGPRTPLISGAAGTWEAAGVSAPTVEGPFAEIHNGTYYLFYSGGSYAGAYGIGYATATSPAGPFTKSASNPIFTDTATVFAPGGGDELVTGPHGGLWLLYAARLGSDAAVRTLWLDPFAWQPSPTAGVPDVPAIAGPTSTPQPTQP